MNRGGDLRSA